MKQLLKLSLLMLAMLLPTIAAAHDFEAGGIYYNITGNNEVTVTYKGTSYSSKAYSGDVVIPETVIYNGASYLVTAIDKNAFRSCSDLTSIDIPNTVTAIGNYAFIDCPGLTSIAVASDNPIFDSRGNCNAIIETASNTLISGCQNTIIPNSVTAIGVGAFYKCTGLTSVTIPSSVASIGNYAFYICTGLTSVTIPNSVTSIGNYAFYNCSSLTSLIIPSSVTAIAYNAFYYCSGLTSIDVDEGNPNYDSRNNCNALIETASNTLIRGCQNTVIPNTVTSIGYGAFENCTGLASVSIPNSVITIGGSVFYGCTGLTSVTFGNSLNTIGNDAFAWCTGLTDVTIPNSVTTIGSEAFWNCLGLTSVTLGNSLNTIGNDAFAGCTGLTDVTVPNSVTTIGEGAFAGCYGLNSFVVEEGNPNYDSRDNCNALIETATNTLIAGCKNTVIPNTVTAIRDYVFYGCPGLKTVLIPNSVTSIGEGAFASCPELTDVYCFNEDPSAVALGNDCFKLEDGDYSSRTLHVPFGYTYSYQYDNRWNQYFGNIVDSNFSSDGINYRMMNANEVAVTRTYGFTGEAIIPETVTYDGMTFVVTAIDEEAFLACVGLTKVSIPNTVTTIGNYAFEDCTNLASITIPESVISIGDAVFRCCPKLTTMTVASDNPVYDSRENCNAIIETASNTLIAGCQNTVVPNGIMTIGYGALWDCTTLTHIELPNTVVNINKRAFRGCTGLTSVNLPNSVIFLGEDAFCWCSNLVTINLGNSLSYIGKDAFRDCWNLTSITLPSTVTTIDGRAFMRCYALDDVYSHIIDPSAITVVGDALNILKDDGYVYNAADFSGRTLYVPAGSLAAYQADVKWYPYFGNIVEIATVSGDVDGDGNVTIGDVTKLIDLLIGGGISVTDYPSADVDGDGNITIGDVTRIIDMLLYGN